MTSPVALSISQSFSEPRLAWQAWFVHCEHQHTGLQPMHEGIGVICLHCRIASTGQANDTKRNGCLPERRCT
ncbi:hypothetical protein CGCA056_v001236 [Colletotrichum aenigma]|uniref:uncharacterized protein n=1 Tax=Colletotrichum aenigma TaxID=1215731 RepID=UPI00187302ED|nr:uncharacterized protein CGCA056_v001236 [Colletotrichum aenigma]KAF5526827.1 hypothetical protein CGCA056_v001236 [Colletotrichum aenigma]